MKRTHAIKLGAAAALLGALILAGGCQSPGKTTATEASTVCPMCKTETVTTPIKGLERKKHICPQCKQVVTDDASSTALASYTSMDQKTVHVCTACDAVVETCPQCAAKH